MILSFFMQNIFDYSAILLLVSGVFNGRGAKACPGYGRRDAENIESFK